MGDIKICPTIIGCFLHYQLVLNFRDKKYRWKSVDLSKTESTTPINFNPSSRQRRQDIQVSQSIHHQSIINQLPHLTSIQEADREDNMCRLVDQLVNQSINQSINPSINQSIN